MLTRVVVISVYDIRRAVKDKATEGDELHYKEKLRTQRAALEAVAGAEKRIGSLAEDFVNHWDARLEAKEISNGELRLSN